MQIPKITQNTYYLDETPGAAAFLWEKAVAAGDKVEVLLSNPSSQRNDGGLSDGDCEQVIARVGTCVLDDLHIKVVSATKGTIFEKEIDEAGPTLPKEQPLCKIKMSTNADTYIASGSTSCYTTAVAQPAKDIEYTTSGAPEGKCIPVTSAPTTSPTFSPPKMTADASADPPPINTVNGRWPSYVSVSGDSGTLVSDEVCSKKCGNDGVVVKQCTPATQDEGNTKLKCIDLKHGDGTQMFPSGDNDIQASEKWGTCNRHPCEMPWNFRDFEGVCRLGGIAGQKQNCWKNATLGDLKEYRAPCAHNPEYYDGCPSTGGSRPCPQSIKNVIKECSACTYKKNCRRQADGALVRVDILVDSLDSPLNQQEIDVWKSGCSCKAGEKGKDGTFAIDQYVDDATVCGV